MPDWCMNKLTVSGSSDGVKKFSRRAVGLRAVYAGDDSGSEESPLRFNSLYPVPPEVLAIGYDDQSIDDQKGFDLATRISWRCRSENGEMIEPRNVRLDGYNWQSIYWGVKWEPIVDSVTVSDQEAEYCFETPWCAPVPFFHKVSQDFPDLIFSLRYCIPAMDIAGYATWEGGELIEEESGDLQPDDKIEWNICDDDCADDCDCNTDEDHSFSDGDNVNE